MVDENRVAGVARDPSGKAQEGVGKLAGDVESNVKGKVNQAVGAAQDLYGQAKDSASEVASVATDRVTELAADIEDYVRRTIEQRPYTTAVTALCLGWVIGRLSGRDRR